MVQEDTRPQGRVAIGPGDLPGSALTPPLLFTGGSVRSALASRRVLILHHQSKKVLYDLALILSSTLITELNFGYLLLCSLSYSVLTFVIMLWTTALGFVQKRMKEASPMASDFL